MKQTNLEAAYQFCQQMANSHYENFPVASVLLPKKLRRPISVIYAFARTADDFADEGNISQQHRLHQLDAYSDALQAIANNNYQGNHPIFIALTDVIEKYRLPISLFDDLLSAFKQDVVKNRYATFDEVLDYCSRSANPVGRLLLLLNGIPTEQQLQQSDAICTALQLINFYQDIEQDHTESDRIYLPTDELEQFGVSEQQLVHLQTTDLAPLLRLHYKRTQQLMATGKKLGTSVKGRIGWEIRAMTLGGVTILNKLMSQNDNALLNRPRINKWTLLKIALISCSSRLYLYIVDKLLIIDKP
jgi:squalene synthase HpnC